MLDSNAKYIHNRLALRPPQRESLERFQQIVDVLSLEKEPDLERELEKIRALFPTLTSFERQFPSVCFSLATGIGKTRLMGAFIAYLHYAKGIKNFFVTAPNLTIYKKLKADLGDPASEKYVFRGLDKFVNPPRIVDGDNYEEYRQIHFDEMRQPVTINIFNISKLNAELKTRDNKPARIRRMKEALGTSYFEHLKALPDLCIFMDESHHYYADRSFGALNELKPILGVELTATPQTQKGARVTKFQNVVYEYSLAHALNDGMYVKVPVVYTRKDFRPEEYAGNEEQLDREKLNDGIRLHEATKSELDVYARNYGKPVVKPFVLVVAKDTGHSRQIREYLTSQDFFHGYYEDKVLEINSTLRGAEKDSNIELLLSLEQPDNRIEIVIHVNMLKEGWDVTNLYTIIPLRASASETLTEQTIGRGLRLPYGARTGVDEADRLSIVSHDRYEDIVKLANDPRSLVRLVYYIDPTAYQDDDKRESLPVPTAYDEATSAPSLTEQLAFTLQPNDAVEVEKIPAQVMEAAQFVASMASKTVMELGRQVKTLDGVRDRETRRVVRTSIVNETARNSPHLDLKKEDIEAAVDAAIESCVQALTRHVIPIPQIVVQPFTETRHGFTPFPLDTKNLSWHPSDNTLLGTELQEGGRTFEYTTDVALFTQADTVENEIARHIIVHDIVDYATCADLIYSLIGEAKAHFLTYLSPEQTETVMRERQRSLADFIYEQMKEHFYKEETRYRASSVRPFSKIETGFAGKFQSDHLYDLHTPMASSEVSKKVFTGFERACHTLYKFDSDTERTFAIVLERDDAVRRWMRPSPRQFDLYYGATGEQRYVPDFIVETDDTVYMVETKNAMQLKLRETGQKAAAGEEYCRAVSQWNKGNGGKPWAYVLIPHSEVKLQSSFVYLVQNSVPLQQLTI